jgi:hypothetical protein
VPSAYQARKAHSANKALPERSQFNSLRQHSKPKKKSAPCLHLQLSRMPLALVSSLSSSEREEFLITLVRAARQHAARGRKHGRRMTELGSGKATAWRCRDQCPWRPCASGSSCRDCGGVVVNLTTPPLGTAPTGQRELRHDELGAGGSCSELRNPCHHHEGHGGTAYWVGLRTATASPIGGAGARRTAPACGRVRGGAHWAAHT